VTVIAAEVVEIKASLRPEIQVVAQDCRVKKGGAFTGEVRRVEA
jgi:triosephosphate isomerase